MGGNGSGKWRTAARAATDEMHRLDVSVLRLNEIADTLTKHGAAWLAGSEVSVHLETDGISRIERNGSVQLG